MSGNKYLLDTNIIVDLFSGNQKINKLIAPIKETIVSAITIGELYFGVEKSQHRKKHLKQVGEFIEICTVLDVDLDTTKVYGKIKNELKKKGHPIPENDLWIAATCIQHGLTLITRDKHFNGINQLVLKQIN